MTDIPAARDGRFSFQGIAWKLKSIDKSIVLWVLLILFLLFLVVNPLAHLFISSFQDVEDQHWTLYNYVYAFSKPRFLRAIWNSVQYAFFVACVGTMIGVPIGWAVSRTDIPVKNLVRLMVLASFVTPSYLAAVAWILLAGPNAGWLNRAFMWLTGSPEGIFNIYSMTGLVFVTALHSFPYMFVFTSSALGMISSEMEDAANILGAGRWTTTFRVTLPLAVPALTGGFIVMFLETLALFGVPSMLAVPARFHTMTTQLFQFFYFPVRVEMAAAYAIPLLTVTVILFWAQKRLLARKGYASVTGKGGERRPIPLGRGKWLVMGFIVLVGVVSLVLPYVVLGQAAFAKAWGNGFSWDNFTLANMKFVLFDHKVTQQSILNSLKYSLSAALIAISLALCIAYIVNRRLVPFGGALTFLAMAPFVIPGIVLAIGFFTAYAGPPWYLYGTAFILIFAFSARYMPIAYANSDAAIKSIHPELEEAVRTLGGSRLTAVRKVVAPLLRPTLLGAGILVFIPAMRELSAAIFLYSANTPVLSVQLYIRSDEGFFEILAALGFVLLGVSLLVVALGIRFLGRDFLLRGE